MSSSIQPALLLIGSGPGIGLSTATLFATKKSKSVGIISRNASRLAQDQQAIEEEALKSGSEVKVSCWSVDITKPEPFENVLKLAKETLGNITCVIFNAARVAPSELLKFPEEEIMEDFKASVISSPRSALLTASADHKHSTVHHSQSPRTQPISITSFEPPVFLGNQQSALARASSSTFLPFTS